MHASRGVPAAHAYQSEKSSIGFDRKRSRFTVHPDSGPSDAEIVSVCVARGDVEGASKSDILSRFVASKRSPRQGVDVTKMFSVIAWRTVTGSGMPLAFSTRSRTELNLEMPVVAAMLAASS
jgi:hypothetical protein